MYNTDSTMESKGERNQCLDVGITLIRFVHLSQHPAATLFMAHSFCFLQSQIGYDTIRSYFRNLTSSSDSNRFLAPQC